MEWSRVQKCCVVSNRYKTLYHIKYDILVSNAEAYLTRCQDGAFFAKLVND